jgi:hypothetical protein
MMKKGITLLFLGMLSVSRANEIGFDPGMNKALAASMEPTTGRYQEYCPDSPTGRCYGTLAAGSGFYTIPLDIDPIEVWNDTKDAFTHYFQWKRDAKGKLIAELQIDTRYYRSQSTPSFYAGLQENIPIGKQYAGISIYNPLFSPNSKTIDHASLEYRAVVCPQNNDPYFLTLHYYSDGWSLQRQDGYSLAFNYAYSWNTGTTPLIFESALTTQGKYMREHGFTESAARIYDTTFWIDSHRYGMLPMPSNNSAITVSCTKDIESIPFQSVTFNIQKFLTILSAKNIIYPVEEYQYSGGIIAGVEMWGRAKVTIQVKNHTMRDEPLTQTEIIPVGKFRMPDNSLWYSNGMTAVCEYINLQHAGVSSVQEINRTITTIPPAMMTGWCSGYNTIKLF